MSLPTIAYKPLVNNYMWMARRPTTWRHARYGSAEVEMDVLSGLLPRKRRSRPGGAMARIDNV